MQRPAREVPLPINSASPEPDRTRLYETISPDRRSRLLGLVAAIVEGFCLVSMFLVVLFRWPTSGNSLGQAVFEFLVIVACYLAMCVSRHANSRSFQALEIVDGILHVTFDGKTRPYPLLECHWFEGWSSHDWQSPFVLTRPALCIVHPDMGGIVARQCVARGLSEQTTRMWLTVLRANGVPRAKSRSDWHGAGMLVTGAAVFASTRFALDQIALNQGLQGRILIVGFLVALAMGICAASAASVLLGSDIIRFRAWTILYMIFPTARPLVFAILFVRDQASQNVLLAGVASTIILSLVIFIYSRCGLHDG